MNKILTGVFIFLLVISKELPAQFLTMEQSAFLKRDVKTICKDESLTNYNWKSVDAAIADKRIILLGELNHGSREISLLRNAFIKYLHQQKGFDVVLFESGIGELLGPDINKYMMTASEMTNGLFGSWRNAEFRQLMEYIKVSKLSFSGFDVQRTGRSFQQELKQIADKANIDSAAYINLEDNYGLIQRELTNRKAIYDSVSVKTTRLINGYQSMLTLLQKSTSSNSSKEMLLTQRTVVNRIIYLQYMLQFVKDKNWNKRWDARDAAMADNISWLAKNIYAGKKIIVIGHNYHIAMFNEKQQVMGALVKKTFNEEMYSIGIFAGSGKYADNSGVSVKMVEADSTRLDIKHIIRNQETFASYIDIPKTNEAGGGWLNKPIIVNDTFIDLEGTNEMILARQFDGLFLIQKISLPEK